MNIIPINSGSAITPFKSVLETANVQGAASSTSPFRDMFTDAVSNLEELNEIKSQDGIALSLGSLDDIGAMKVNSEKAEVSLQLLVQMRNKVLESYQEIMRTNI